MGASGRAGWLHLHHTGLPREQPDRERGSASDQAERAHVRRGELQPLRPSSMGSLSSLPRAWGSRGLCCARAHAARHQEAPRCCLDTHESHNGLNPQKKSREMQAQIMREGKSFIGSLAAGICPNAPFPKFPWINIKQLSGTAALAPTETKASGSLSDR